MYDIVVIGGGPAGIEAALKAGELGAKTALVERWRLGGISTNDGCVPVRALAHAARLARESEQFELYGICGGDRPQVDFAKVLARVRDVVDTIHAKKDLPGQLASVDVDVFEHASGSSFKDERTLVLGDGRQIQSQKFIICAGGHGRRLNFPGSEYALTHSDIWAQSNLPKRVVVTGTGATGCQVASVLSAFGAEVHLFDRSQRILRTEDELVSQVVAAEFTNRGINIVYGYGGIKRLEKQADGSFEFFYDINGEEQSLACDALIMAAGWPGNTAQLNLAAVGVNTTKRGYIEVNDYLQTSNPNIYAAGDITGLMMVVSGATHEGRLAAENAILGNKRKYKHKIAPLGSFTDPEYASVGLREHEIGDGCEYVVGIIWFSDFVRAVIDNRTAGFCKLIVDVDTRKIIGAHVVGERAVETVNLVAAGMSSGLRVEQLAELEIAYPTYVGIVGQTAREAGRQVGIYLAAEHMPEHKMKSTAKSLH
ncbi:NADPH-glutathione reductase [Thalassoporum mexicanum PCC 7367]|uniref:dihydrolipoyl dehydrogenase family protein n=1 Tax=Thalassoporum mexicanum TaxID=3457544 RepID=UPI00029FDD0D|nr:NAD(P)/FAD-dependent oxidoreductase [Pseudanabaena sp. PCC 7367]AFY68853.1 NADPH-glutathione reductase [Pseudanabaena sp. PCC 7367]